MAPRHAASRHAIRHYDQKHEIFNLPWPWRVGHTIPTLRNSSIHSSGNVTRLGTFKFRGETMHACAIVLDWSWSPIHKLTGLDVGETRWDNATWCNTTPHSYTDGQRRTNWEFVHIISENFFVEQLLRNTNHRRYGSGTPPLKLGDWKGFRWKSDEEVRIRRRSRGYVCMSHVYCL